MPVRRLSNSSILQAEEVLRNAGCEGAAAERSVPVKAIRLIVAFAALALSRAKRVLRLLPTRMRRSQRRRSRRPSSTKSPTRSPTKSPTKLRSRPKKPKRTNPNYRSPKRTSPRRISPTSRRSRQRNRKIRRVCAQVGQEGKADRACHRKGRAGADVAVGTLAAGHLDGFGAAVRRHQQWRSRRAAQRAAIHALDHPAPPVDCGAACPAGALAPALAMAASADTSPLDIAAVKQAIDLAHKGRPDEATNVESTISDPVARKLVEWVILRGDEADLDFPALRRLHRRQSELAGHHGAAPPRRSGAVAAASRSGTPSSTFSAAIRRAPPRDDSRWRARCWPQGDRAGAQAAVREAWRKDGFSADVEGQARDMFAGLITPADDKARMDARFYVEDDDAGLRAAHHLGRRRTRHRQSAHRGHQQIRATPRRCSKQCPRRASTMPATCSAASNGCAAPTNRRGRRMDAGRAARCRSGSAIVDQWWVERRLIARKLLDLGDFKSAYAVANGAATPINENYRAEQQFTAGWIALRFLREPAVALAHFARIAEGVTNPITLARSFYWQGRAAESARAADRMRAPITKPRHAIRPPITANWRGRGSASTKSRCAVRRNRRPTSPASRSLALSRFSMPSTSATSSPHGGRSCRQGRRRRRAGDAGEIATRHNDARTTLLIGKTALGHGLPLEHYAFPDFGVPNYQQIGPQVERCVVYSIVRQESAFNRQGRVQRQRHRPDASHAGGRPRHRQAVQRHVRSAPADVRRRLQRPARHRRTRQ